MAEQHAANPATNPLDNCLCEAGADDVLDEIESAKEYVLKLMEAKPLAIMAIIEIFSRGLQDDVVMKLERLSNRIDAEGIDAVLGEYSRGCDASAHHCICRM